MTRAAAQPTTARALTLEEYLATPETKQRQEVIDGAIVTLPAPTIKHQWVLMNIYRSLFDFVSAGGLGSIIVAPCDLLIRTQPKLQMRQPDLMYFSAARVSPEELRRMRYGEVAPDLAVEIRSEGETKAAWAEKLADYAEIGVAEVWRVHLDDRSVEVLAPDAGRFIPVGLYQIGDVVHSPVLPGLELPVSMIFR